MCSVPAPPTSPEPPIASSRRRRRRVWLWLLGIPLGFVVLLILVITLYVSTKRARISEWLGEERTWWLSLGDDIPDDQNRWLAVEQICQAFRGSGQESSNWLQDRLTRPPGPNDHWPRPYDGPLREAIDERKEFLDRFRAAASLPGFRRPSSLLDNSTADGIFPVGTAVERVHLRRMLIYRGWRAFAEGRWKDGSGDIMAAVRHSVDEAQGGAGIDVSLASSSLSLAASAVREGLFAKDVSSANLGSLATKLRVELQRMPPASQVFRTERLLHLLHFEIGSSPLNRDGVGSRLSGLGVFVEGLTNAAGAERYHSTMGDLIRLADAPFPEWMKGMDKITDVIATKGTANLATRTYVPGTVGLRRNLIGAVAALEVATAALRARAVRLDSGAYPGSPQGLAGSDGMPVPMDPYTGQPLKWRKTKTGSLVIYCVGLNLKDDGGANHDKAWDRAKPPRPPDVAVEERAEKEASTISALADDQGIELK